MGCIVDDGVIMPIVKQWRNLSRHPIKILLPSGNVLDIQPDGCVARSASARRIIEPISYNGIEIQCASIVYENIKLPPEIEGVGLIVSAIVASELRNLRVQRDDIYTVDQIVRDPITHEVCGCAGLIKW